MEHISDIVRRVIAALEKDAVIQTTGEPDGRAYLTGGGSMNCVICSEPIKPLLDPTTGAVVWEHGNNAEPIKEGRCCDDCNRDKVIPRRFEDALGKGEAARELADAVNKAEADAVTLPFNPLKLL